LLHFYTLAVQAQVSVAVGLTDGSGGDDRKLAGTIENLLHSSTYPSVVYPSVD
jgi:hypothetical protein